QSEADLARSEALRVQSTSEFNRVKGLRDQGASSQEEFEKNLGKKQEAEATVQADRAKVARAKLNLSYCSIKAPIAGRIGDTLVTEGNLVEGGLGTTTLLTTIVSVDPMFVAFDVDENTLERVQRAVREKQIPEEKPGEIPAEMGLAVDGTDYPLKGTIIFVNNQVDTKTGTIPVKAQLPNPMPQTGQRLLTDGMYARVRIPIGKPRRALLVPEVAILSVNSRCPVCGIGLGS